MRIVRIDWLEGTPPRIGAYIRSQGGTMYRVVEVRQRAVRTRPINYEVRAEKLGTLNDFLSQVKDWAWHSRGRMA